MRIVSWQWRAQTPPRFTTCTRARAASSSEPTPTWWSGIQTQRGTWWLYFKKTWQCGSQTKNGTGVNWPPLSRCRTISVSTQVQGGDFNLYEGMRCHGVPLVTISRGRLVCENGVFMCAEGSGKFYAQRTFPDYLYKKMVQREKVCFGFSSSTSVFLDLRTFCYCMCSDDESVHLKVNRFPLGTRARSVLHQLTANAPIKLCLHWFDSLFSSLLCCCCKNLRLSLCTLWFCSILGALDDLYSKLVCELFNVLSACYLLFSLILCLFLIFSKFC